MWSILIPRPSGWQMMCPWGWLRSFPYEIKYCLFSSALSAGTNGCFMATWDSSNFSRHSILPSPSDVETIKGFMDDFEKTMQESDNKKATFLMTFVTSKAGLSASSTKPRNTYYFPLLTMCHCMLWIWPQGGKSYNILCGSESQESYQVQNANMQTHSTAIWNGICPEYRSKAMVTYHFLLCSRSTSASAT